jgi:predicted nucleic acid-binding protein
MIWWSQNSFSELWAEILDPKRWAIYKIEAIENCYSVCKFQDFSEKKNILKIQKQLQNGKLSAIIFAVFQYFPFS